MLSELAKVKNFLRKLRTAAAVSVSIVTLVACNVGADEATLLEQARSLEAKGDVAGAYLQVKATLQENPNSGAARYQLGRLLLEQGEAGAAQVELRRALDGHFPPATVLPALARSMLLAKMYKPLVDEFATKRIDDPAADRQLRLMVATAQAFLGQRDAARAVVDEVLARAPADAEAQLLDAKIKVSMGHVEDGFKQVTALSERDPNNADVWQFLGSLRLFSKADVKGAADAFEKAVSIQPRSLSARSSLIAIRLQQNDITAAKLQLEQMRKVLPQHPQTKLFDAQLAFVTNDLAKARDLCVLLLRNLPDDVTVLQMAGAVELKRGALVQAETYLSRAMSLAPELELPRRLLAQTYLRMGQPSKALPTIRPTVERPYVRAETLETAAEVYLNLGQSVMATSLYKQAAELKPNEPRIQTALALANYSKGESQASLESLESIAAADSDTVADMALISVRLRRKEFSLALKAIDALERKKPDSPVPLNLKGRVLIQSGDTPGARASFESALLKDPAFFAAAASLAELDLRAKQPDAAARRFESILKSNPRNGAAAVALAELKLRAGAKAAEVTPILENAVKSGPTDASARLALVNHLLSTNSTQAAVSAAQQAVSALPASPEVLDALGRAQLAVGEPNQSLATFSKLALMVPRSARPHIRSAQVHLVNKNPNAALVSLKRALEIEPHSIEAQHLLTTTALGLKKSEYAQDIAKSMQKQYPKEAFGYLYAGDIEAAQRRWDAAAAAYRQGVDKESPGKLPIRLHLVLMTGKHPDEAERFAESWLKGHPQDAGFLSYLGDAAVASNNFARAEARYGQVLNLRPDDALAMNNVAYIRIVLKKPGARAMSERANELLPDNPLLIDTLASAYAAEGDYASAVTTARRAVTLAPFDANYRLTLAKLLLRAGDKAGARTELEALSKMGAKFGKQQQVTALLKSTQ